MITSQTDTISKQLLNTLHTGVNSTSIWDPSICTTYLGKIVHLVRIIIRDAPDTDFVRYPADRLFGHSKSRIPDIRCGRITDIRLSSLSKANYFRNRYVFSLFINSTFVLSNKQQQKMQKNEDRLFVIHKIIFTSFIFSS